MRWVFGTVAAFFVVVGALFLGLFIVQNSGHTAELSLELPYPPRRWAFVHPTTGQPLPVLLLMGVSFLLGLISGFSLLVWQAVRSGRKVRALRHELALRPTISSRRSKSATSKREEPVTNIATPIRTTANRPSERVTPEPVPADADPETQTRNW